MILLNNKNNFNFKLHYVFFIIYIPSSKYFNKLRLFFEIIFKKNN